MSAVKTFPKTTLEAVYLFDWRLSIAISWPNLTGLPTLRSCPGGRENTGWTAMTSIPHHRYPGYRRCRGNNQESKGAFCLATFFARGIRVPQRLQT
jgi:hypothetical protein